MTIKEKLLVALDEHLTSTEVVKYVRRMTCVEKSPVNCLLHILPPQLRDFRGSEDPKMEQKLNHRRGQIVLLLA